MFHDQHGNGRVRHNPDQRAPVHVHPAADLGHDPVHRQAPLGRPAHNPRPACRSRSSFWPADDPTRHHPIWRGRLQPGVDEDQTAHPASRDRELALPTPALRPSQDAHPAPRAHSQFTKAHHCSLNQQQLLAPHAIMTGWGT